VVPLIYQDKVIGVLDLEHTKRGFFTEDHQRTITTLAAQIAIAIENARLYEQIARQERRLERDLQMARELQFRLLPQSRPKLTNLEVAAKFSPARQIGGDLYDFLAYVEPRSAFAIGDVSGKGAPAAIYAALVAGILRSHAPMEPTPSEMLAALNYSLAERRIDGQFVSLIYAVWDDEQRTLQVANSGLPRPVYCHNGKTKMIEATGLPLGLFEDAEYDEFTFQAEAEDLFVFFSDGILDSTNAAGELFGRTRLEKIIAEGCGNSAEAIVKSIFQAVVEHARGVETFDDQTVVAIKVKGSGPKRK
jgi:sigma-B regulation protein RsbU (phosphoserine phosphatase)